MQFHDLKGIQICLPHKSDQCKKWKTGRRVIKRFIYLFIYLFRTLGPTRRDGPPPAQCLIGSFLKIPQSESWSICRPLHQQVHLHFMIDSMIGRGMKDYQKRLSLVHMSLDPFQQLHFLLVVSPHSLITLNPSSPRKKNRFPT